MNTSFVVVAMVDKVGLVTSTLSQGVFRLNILVMRMVLMYEHDQNELSYLNRLVDNVDKVLFDKSRVFFGWDG